MVPRVAWVGVVAIALTACNGSRPKRAPLLPPTAKFVPEPPAQDKSAGYRNQAGQAIAPLVIADEGDAPEIVPAAGPPGGNPRATLNGDPGGITRETLNRSIQGAMGSLASCFTSLTQDPMVAVSFEADPSGRPSLVRVNGAPPDAESCIRSVVQGIRFPSFEGKGVQVDLPLSFHRTATQAKPANHPTPQQVAAPPLFMDP
jgi:hypothetical protein